ncbi:unnamed protein product [Dovyalis caffra]|uniref:Uncharacterized protein n=1 Tax=Dovyalis caffra TaxID=77055 RepID=A0AAV1RAN7_9ROSI|nr:unnamed protein product [Dovyalis caffra]
MVYRGRYYPEARSRNCRKTSQTQYRSSSSVPRWEKEFCLDVGNLLEAKKYISETNEIMQWDDSEGKECFYNAKNRLWALNYGRAPYCRPSLPNPDKYIDEIDWNSEFDTQLLMELEEARKPVPRKEESSVVDNPWMLPVEQIRPTGWDVREDPYGPRLLTGMIVGDGKD